MTIKTLKINEDGLVPELQIIGYAGRLGSNQAPAYCSHVIADRNNHRVWIQEQVGQELTVEVWIRPTHPCDWGSTGTRIDPPWAFRCGFWTMILSDREIAICGDILSGVLHSRDGEITAWYCSPEKRAEIWACVAEQARKEVLSHTRPKDLD